MLTQGGTNASNSMKLTSTINQNKINFTYDTDKILLLAFTTTFNHFETFPFLLSNCTLIFTRRLILLQIYLALYSF